ncbi:MAG: ATPase [SAR92 bacterium BACL26 MAG-121220-bin70]|uniref:Cell division protein ZapE n=1 Tax=SAR92 bacterium BACL26 MAG-121220-bin70 TaxID=1655626 RepID=A0A0R2UCA9_9GAMM|nr:MAG: ATPase [SAR92 bacterium BACL26 MAG-121220-bin70]
MDVQIMPSPRELYQIDLNQEGFIADPSQDLAVTAFEDLYQRLLLKQKLSCEGMVRSAVRRLFQSPLQSPKGLYVWGGVGRGKTYLMDTFYESLPFGNKMRVHFHRFMRRIHQDLRSLEGEINPLRKVAGRIADETCIICFDEFFVSDIADAMILAGLLDELFRLQVCLVTTSNIVPDLLYRDGLQRRRFLPAIDLLKKHCEVINIGGDTDYRLRALEKAPLYCSPLGNEADADIEAIFNRLVPVEGEIKLAVDLEVEGRSIPVVKLSEDIVWFQFASLCEGPRSQNDYIDIAREFHAVIITNIPMMGDRNNEAARRFINLVDEFYDRNVKVAISAAESLPNLYSGTRLAFEFERTQSRLLEMQSHEYLARPHCP